MYKVVKIAKVLINVFRYKLNTRPKVYWCLIDNADDPYSKVSKNNFGDMLSPFIVQRLTGKLPIYFDPKRVVGGKYIEYTCMVGSIIQFVQKNCVIWGSGVLSSNVNVECKREWNS